MTRLQLRLAPLLCLLGVMLLAHIPASHRASADPLPPAGEAFDVLVRGGTVYDGGGQAPRAADLGIRGNTNVAVGDLKDATAKTVIRALPLT